MARARDGWPSAIAFLIGVVLVIAVADVVARMPVPAPKAPHAAPVALAPVRPPGPAAAPAKPRPAVPVARQPMVRAAPVASGPRYPFGHPGPTFTVDPANGWAVLVGIQHYAPPTEPTYGGIGDVDAYWHLLRRAG